MITSITRPVPAASDHDLGDDLSAGNSWPVVVVGAGPAGSGCRDLVGACGNPMFVLNKRTRPAEHPRATVISQRSTELFRSWGMADAITAGGHEVEWLMLVTTTMSEVAAGVPVQVGYPSVAESALLSPTRLACVRQDHLEAVLTAHLKELPAARLVTGIDVEDISQSLQLTRLGGKLLVPRYRRSAQSFHRPTSRARCRRCRSLSSAPARPVWLPRSRWRVRESAAWCSTRGPALPNIHARR